MKTIEELAIENGILKLHEQSLEGSVYIVGNVTVTNLDTFAKAYMQGRLSSLEPIVWLWGSAKANAWQIAYEEPVSHDDSIEIRPLCYISTLKDKP